MTVELHNSGERLIEDAYFRSHDAYVIYVTHAASYRFAEGFCAGRKVLDLGCGSGYGAARIAAVADSVHGVDVSQDAISFANTRYHAPNLTYSRIEPDSRLPFDDHSFDVALSFQVIEHVWDETAYLREARRVLKPGGLMIVITPDRQHRLLPAQKPWNRWHVREHSVSSMERVIAGVFELRQSLRMGAPWRIAGAEIRRYRKVKWLTLPFTLPFVPESLRRQGLDLIHALRKTPVVVDANASDALPQFDFDESDVLIEANPPHSMNLVMVAQKSGARESGEPQTDGPVP